MLTQGYVAPPPGYYPYPPPGYPYPAYPYHPHSAPGGYHYPGTAPPRTVPTPSAGMNALVSAASEVQRSEKNGALSPPGYASQTSSATGTPYGSYSRPSGHYMEPPHGLPSHADFARHSNERSSTRAALEEQRKVSEENDVPKSRRTSNHHHVPYRGPHSAAASHDDLGRNVHDVSHSGYHYQHPGHGHSGHAAHHQSNFRSHRHAYQPYSHPASAEPSRANSPVSSHSGDFSDEDRPQLPFGFTPSSSPVLGPLKGLTLIQSRSTGQTSAAPSAQQSPVNQSRPSSPVYLPPLRLSSALLSSRSRATSPADDVEMADDSGSIPLGSSGRPATLGYAYSSLPRGSESSQDLTSSVSAPHHQGSAMRRTASAGGEGRLTTIVTKGETTRPPTPEFADPTIGHKGRLEDILNGHVNVHQHSPDEIDDRTLPPLSSLIGETANGPRGLNHHRRDLASSTSSYFQSRSAPASRHNTPPTSPKSAGLHRSYNSTSSMEAAGAGAAFPHLTSGSSYPPTTGTTAAASNSGGRRKGGFGFAMTPLEQPSTPHDSPPVASLNDAGSNAGSRRPSPAAASPPSSVPQAPQQEAAMEGVATA